MLIVLLIFVTLIGLIYLALKYKRRCPRCHLSEEYLLPPMAMVPVQPLMGYATPAASYATSSPAFAVPAPPQAQPAAPACASCGTPLSFVEQYQRWWCPREQQYK